MIPRVAILDYGCGNLGSVVNAVRKVGAEPFIWPGLGPTDAAHIILPGQGHFGEAAPKLEQMARYGVWPNPLPSILGICLGMQLMCQESEEAPGVPGLGWIDAKVRRLASKRLPHVGWNRVGWEHDYYFCHSYCVLASNPLGDTQRRPWSLEFATYDGQHFVAQFQQGNLWAVQFHPEKSGKAGLAFLKEFLTL